MPAPDRRRSLTAFLVAMAVLVATPLAVVAADAFTDVPNTNVFHEDIAWLADAGVTKGCNPPANTEFCPSDNVTREQMSAFMRRLAQYMDAEDGTPGQADHATTADSASSADSATTASNVNGITIDRFFYQAPTGTTDAVIGTYGPITLKATCEAGNVPVLRASWDETVNHLTFEGSSGALFGNATVNAGQTINIGSGAFGSVGLAEAVGFDSHVHTSVEYFLRRSPALGDNMCFFSGFVTVG